MTSTEYLLAEIDDVLNSYQRARGTSAYDDISDLGASLTSEILTRLAATIDRLAPPGSQYRESTKAVLQKFGASNSVGIPKLVGFLRALRADYAMGHLRRVEQLIQADLFSDFLEMSEHLLDQGYKDASAVLLGGVLEEQLRKLCIQHGISISSGGKFKKADLLNAELGSSGIYNKLDQKAVTAWLDLRNKAAHGLYGEYTIDQVRIMLKGIHDFSTRHF